jgi:hypothetical protein
VKLSPLGETAFGGTRHHTPRDHDLTKDSARVTADALDALGRTEEAKALRERYGSRVLTILSPHEH